MILDKVNSRIYSRLGQRGSIFGMAALDLAKEDEKLLLMTADLAQLSGMDRFIKTYPNQFINVGIAEQNMVGMAAGLVAEGFKPVVTTYATFLTMRSCEQMRHFMGYMNLPIVAIGSGAGLSQGFAGNTHYTIEDISMMRAIPCLTIYSPADAGSAVKIFEKAVNENKPAYIRLTGNLNCPIVYKEDVDFSSILSYECRKTESTPDITIMAVGTMVSSALKSADILSQQGIVLSVVDMFSVKPIDKDAINKASKSKLMVTIEEHNKIGGLGGSVAEVMCDNGYATPLLRLGVNDSFDAACDYEGLLAQNRLTPELIAEDILNKFKTL
jgi:transketolase